MLGFIGNAIALGDELVDAPQTFALVDLRPSEFRWIRSADPAIPLAIVVSIPRQQLFVVQGSELLAISSVSTGRRKHATPTGEFVILEKRRRHFSNLYDNAPMPFMQRLTWGGIALHAGDIPGYPASHGCIRLPREFARQLFQSTQIGTRVMVTAEAFAATAPILSSLNAILTPAIGEAGRDDETAPLPEDSGNETTASSGAAATLAAELTLPPAID
jgi:hypothetical protein